MKKTLIAASLLTCFSAQAALFNVNPGTGDTYTGASVFRFQINNAESVYYQNPTNSGNSVSVGDLFTDVGSITFSDFGVSGGVDSGGCATLLDPNGPCQGNTWGLTAEYNFYGAVGVDPITGTLGGGILGGYIDIFDASSQERVLSFAIVGSSGPNANSVGLNIFGQLDYSGFDFVNGDMFTGDLDSALAYNYFNFSTPQYNGGLYTTNFFDLWQAGINATPNEFLNSITVTTLSAVGGGLTPIESLVYGSDTADFAFSGSPFQNAHYANQGFVDIANLRTTVRDGETLSGNISFQVPEPTSIAILGAGLLGMGFVGRRRRKAA